jgi:hypothetical protein
LSSPASTPSPWMSDISLICSKSSHLSASGHQFVEFSQTSGHYRVVARARYAVASLNFEPLGSRIVGGKFKEVS